MSDAIENLWYGKKQGLRWALIPFAVIYGVISWLRRHYLRNFRQQNFPVPVIVVGNITVGGVGKTPLVVAIAKAIQARGLRVGIVSRGYGAKIRQFPHEVALNDAAELVGDEPLLLARKTACPVVIAPNRTQAVQYLLDKHQSQIILSDDGLQHYAMGRAIEIVVIDGSRYFGNGLCLPAGPLREGLGRLQESDLLVVNGGSWPGAHSMSLEPGEFTELLTGKVAAVENLVAPVAAVAAIGHPQRFFSTLEKMGVLFNKYPFPDHHPFKKNELEFTEKTVVMTEKDAVKCQDFALNSWYFLPVEARLSDSFWQALWSHERLQGHI